MKEEPNKELRYLLESANERFPGYGFDVDISSFALAEYTENPAHSIPEANTDLMLEILAYLVALLDQDYNISSRSGYAQYAQVKWGLLVVSQIQPVEQQLQEFMLWVETFSLVLTGLERKLGSFAVEKKLPASCYKVLLLECDAYVKKLEGEFKELEQLLSALQKLQLTDNYYKIFINFCNKFREDLGRFHAEKSRANFNSLVELYLPMMFCYETTRLKLFLHKHSYWSGGEIPQAVAIARTLSVDEILDCAKAVEWPEVAAIALARDSAAVVDCETFFDVVVADTLTYYFRYGQTSACDSFMRNLRALFNSTAYTHLSPNDRSRLVDHIKQEMRTKLGEEHPEEFIGKWLKAETIPPLPLYAVGEREQQLKDILTEYDGFLAISRVKDDGDIRGVSFSDSEKLQREFTVCSKKVCAKVATDVLLRMQNEDICVVREGDKLEYLQKDEKRLSDEIDALLLSIKYSETKQNGEPNGNNAIKLSCLVGDISVPQFLQKAEGVDWDIVSCHQDAEVIKLKRTVQELQDIYSRQRASALGELLPKLRAMRGELNNRKLRARIDRVGRVYAGKQDADVIKRAVKFQNRNVLSRTLLRLLRRGPRVSADQAVRLISENSDNMQLVTYFLSGATAHRMSGEQLAGLYDIDGIDSRLLDKKIQGNSKLRRRYDAAVRRVQQEDFVLGTQRVITDKIVASRTTAQVTSFLQAVPQLDATSTGPVERVTLENFRLFSRTPTQSQLDTTSVHSHTETVTSVDTDETDCTDETNGIVEDARLAADSPARGRPPVIERIEGNGKEVIGRIEEGETSLLFVR